MLDAFRPSCGATDCQISSVMNGTIGCNARNEVSSTTSNVWRVDAAASAACPGLDPGSPLSAGLESSRNQSQYSFHTNSYNACARWSKRYVVKCCSTSASVWCRRERIQRSASVFPPSPACGGGEFVMFINTNRAAFHNLLQKAL